MPAPVCGKCQKPHFNFVACEKADEWTAKHGATRVTGPPLNSVLRSVPDGFTPASGWGQPDGFGRGWGRGPEAA